MNQLLKSKTFDEFRVKVGASFTTKFPRIETKTNWIDAECDCSNYFKLFMCEHILGIAQRKKYVKPPPEAKNIKLGQKRKPGRPRKLKKALDIEY